MQSLPFGRRSHRLLASIAVLAGLTGLMVPDAVRLVGAAESLLHGRWMIDSRDDRDWIQLNFMVRDGKGHSSWSGRDITLAKLQGLTGQQLAGPSSDVHFTVRREAGTFDCQGRVSGGEGGGVFDLVLDDKFADALDRRGVGRPTQQQQARLAFADVGIGLLDELKGQRLPTPDVDELVTMGEHGVTLDYVKGMSDLGYRMPTLGALVQARDHGVDPKYVEGLQKAGFDRLEYEELLRARDHGVDTRYIAEMVEFSKERMTLDQLIELRDHGVDGRYVREMRKLGLTDGSLASLKRSRDHGVDPHFVADMADAGYDGLSLESLVRARDHGVDGRYARRYNQRVGRKVSLEQLIQARDRGEN